MADTTARDFLAAARLWRKSFEIETSEHLRVHLEATLIGSLDAFLIAHPTAEDAETEIGRAARSDRSGLPGGEEVFALRLHVGTREDDEPCEDCGVDPSDIEMVDDEYAGPFATRDEAESAAEQWANEMGDELDETQTWSWSILKIKKHGKGTGDQPQPCGLQHSDDGPKKCPKCDLPAALGVEGVGSQHDD